MAPARKIQASSKILAKKARVGAKDPMVELEEGLFRLTTYCNAMDEDEQIPGPLFYDPMDIDWLGIIEELIMYITYPPMTTLPLATYFPPPSPLLRSQADFPPPDRLVRSQADFLPSAAGIV